MKLGQIGYKQLTYFLPCWSRICVIVNFPQTLPSINFKSISVLDLSQNSFITKLETLDLSHNQLSGQIPGSSSSLTSINHLDFSYYNLSGRIPTENQLQTLDASTIYLENSFLCGSPLQNKCPGDEPAIVPSLPDANSSAEAGEDEDPEKQGLHIGIGLGFALGFVGISSALLQKKLRNLL